MRYQQQQPKKPGVRPPPKTSSFESLNPTPSSGAPILVSKTRKLDRHPPSQVSSLPIPPRLPQTISQTLLLPLPMTPLLIILPDSQSFPQLLALLNLRRCQLMHLMRFEPSCPTFPVCARRRRELLPKGVSLQLDFLLIHTAYDHHHNSQPSIQLLDLANSAWLTNYINSPLFLQFILKVKHLYLNLP